MASVKRNKKRTDDLLDKMCGKEAVAEKLNSELKSKLGGIPKDKANSKDKGMVADQQKYINGISQKSRYGSLVQIEVAENVKSQVKSYKSEKQKEEELNNEKKKETINSGSQHSDFVKNLPLPAGTIITYQNKIYGQQISQSYMLQDKPKQGGFGFTYIATYAGQNGGSKIAIKEMVPYNSYRNKKTGQLDLDYKDITTKLYKDNFVKEAERIEKLKNDPNIDINTLNLVITETPAFEFNNNWYYVMEYVRGNSLNDIMHSFKDDEEAYKFLPPYSRLIIMEQLCNALFNLHKIGCIHQDISPNNIMIDFDKNGNIELKVIDYGLATNLYKSSSDSVSAVKDAGTYGFTDVFNRLSDYNDFLTNGEGEKLKLIDIYSLGAILGYLCLLNVEYIKIDNFGLRYEGIIKNNVLVQQIDIDWDKEHNSIIASKMQLNLIKKLVYDATNPDLDARIQSVSDFFERLHDIMKVDEELIRRMKLMAEIKLWKKSSGSISSYVTEFKNAVEPLVSQSINKEAHVYFKKGTFTLKNADEEKDAILQMEIKIDDDLDGIIERIKSINAQYQEAEACFEEARKLVEKIGPEPNPKIVAIQQWLRDTPVKADKIRLFGDDVKSKVQDYKKAMDIWYKGSEFMTEAEQFRAEIAKVRLFEASDEELDTTLQKTGLADTRYTMAENKWKEAKRMTPPWINKLLKSLLFVLVVAGIGTGGYFGIDHILNHNTGAGGSPKPPVDTTLVKPDSVINDTIVVKPPIIEQPSITKEYLNEIFEKAQQNDSTARERIKEIIDDKVAINYIEGKTPIHTYELSTFLSKGNNKYIIGQTHKINRFSTGTDGKVITIILEKLN